jgi:hypothetical protein
MRVRESGRGRNDVNIVCLAGSEHSSRAGDVGSRPPPPLPPPRFPNSAV